MKVSVLTLAVNVSVPNIKIKVTVPVEQLPANICAEVDSCLGISNTGDPDKYLNEQGDWVTLNVPPAFIESVDNTATINLSVNSGELTADFASMDVSQFTNDAGYLTSGDLSGYVPYTGATQNVDLGTHGIKADYVEFNLTPTAAAGAGKIVYDGATGALKYLLNNSNVTSQIGQTLHAYVHNAENVQITKGQAVYLFSASGNKASVKLANNTGDATSAKTFGLAAENIGANQNGMVICQGVLDGLNTGGYNAGDTLYLGPTAGGLTATKPYAPNHLVYIGVVERANNGNGQIYVKVQNGYELDELHNVAISSPQPNDIITYNSVTSLWENNPPSVLNSERRNDWNAPYSYCGTAPNGSAESASVWTIYRIQVANDGTVTVLSAINVKWTDRYIVIYT